MKKHNQEYLKTQYRDLLDEISDPALEQLIGDLDTLYRAAPEPPRHLTTLTAETMLRELEYGQLKRRGSWQREWGRGWTGSRLVLAGMAATILLVVGVIIGLVVSTTGPKSIIAEASRITEIPPTIVPLEPTPTPIPTALRPTVPPPVSDPAHTGQPEAGLCTGTLYCIFDSVAKLGLTQAVNQSRHVDRLGINVTVKRVYADATQVYVWYSVSGLVPGTGMVLIGDNLQLPGITNGPLSHNQHWNSTLAGQQISTSIEAVSVFELPRSNSNPKELGLRFTVSKYSVYPAKNGISSGANMATVVLNDPTVISVGFPTPTMVSRPGTTTNIFSEPLTFDFKATLQESRIIEVNKDMTVNNIRLFLSHAVIMPDETRLFLRKNIMHPNNVKTISQDASSPLAQLLIDGKAIQNSIAAVPDPSNHILPGVEVEGEINDIYSLVIRQKGLLEKPGEWTLRINMYNTETKVLSTDSWTFKFNYS